MVLFGPTGVGKTEALSQILTTDFEVISADSVQVYRYLDIGSAKPDPATLAAIPHHLVDLIDPSEEFNCGDFVRSTEALIAAIHARGRMPVVAGGSAYYLRNLVFGLPDGPGADMVVRSALQRECAERGVGAMWKELRETDPVSAEQIPPGDTYRILRALEIYRSTGRRRSEIRVPEVKRTDLRMLLLGLWRERQELYARIDRRVDRMFSAGLVDEVKGLVRRGYGARDPGLRGIGYREFFQMRGGCWSIGDVRSAIKADTRRYAKRQMTFFRSIDGVRWLGPGCPNSLSEMLRDFCREETGR